jgi:uncharacterized protein YecE (DUF72 family)
VGRQSDNPAKLLPSVQPRCHPDSAVTSLRSEPSLSARPALIGTAGWSIPRASTGHFPLEGTHLQRYAAVLGCAEINSSFHRSHSIATYQKWAASTPPGFRFSVKVPRTITHDRKLARARQPLERFLQESAGLGLKRGPLLVQLPPSLAFSRTTAARFFGMLRDRFDGPVVCEPRHETWFSAAADALLVRYRTARVAADPPPSRDADRPGGWDGLIYFRLHGAPRRYWSRYASEYVEAMASAIRTAAASTETWCVFDNTASGAALENALEMQRSTLHQHHL